MFDFTKNTGTTELALMFHGQIRSYDSLRRFQFSLSYDDLDWAITHHLPDFNATLGQYLGGSRNLCVFVTPDDPDPAGTCTRVLDHLGLTQEDLIWCMPSIRTQMNVDGEAIQLL
jgi:hypothetical protein